MTVFGVAARGINAVGSSVGDEILEVNGESLHGLTHDEALHKFKVRQRLCASSNNRTLHRSTRVSFKMKEQ